jgi:hypothetical protein
MLRLSSVQVESLWDDVLPDEVRALPEDLAALTGRSWPCRLAWLLAFQSSSVL